MIELVEVEKNRGDFNGGGFTKIMFGNVQFLSSIHCLTLSIQDYMRETVFS